MRPRGFTLIEVMVAMGVFGVVILFTFSTLNQAANEASIDTKSTKIEDQLQYSVDTIIQDLKETSPSLVSLFSFEGQTQTAIVFPTARDQNGQFYLYKAGETVQSTPDWQGVKVYAYAPDPTGQTDGRICCYGDYNWHSYTNPITVAALDAGTIRLSDGTSFSRTGAAKNGQQIRPLAGEFASLTATGTSPITLTVTSRLHHQAYDIDVPMSLTNEVMSRNRN